MREQHETEEPPIHCFRCTNGCIHVVCFNVTITLKPSDFVVLAEAFDALRIELKQEDLETTDAPSTPVDSLMM